MKLRALNWRRSWAIGTLMVSVEVIAVLVSDIDRALILC